MMKNKNSKINKVKTEIFKDLARNNLNQKKQGSKKSSLKDRIITIYDVISHPMIIILLVVLFIIALSSYLESNDKIYLGKVASVDGRGGYITKIVIVDKTQTSFWQGFYGIANMERGYTESQTFGAEPGGLDEKHLFFDCLSPSEDEHEIYASTNSSLDFNSVSAASIQMVNDFLNQSVGRRDSANFTFTDNLNFTVGSQLVTNVPGVYTYINDEPSSYFDTGILNISGELVFAAHILNLTSGFKGQKSKYQMIVGVPNNSMTYYFYTDPNDECPAGFGTGLLGDGVINGYVTDFETDLPLENVTVAIGGQSNFTDETGLYNLTVPIGDHVLVAMKEGYNTNVSQVEINLSATISHNISLTLFRGISAGQLTFGIGSLAGYTKDNQTGLILSNATVNIQGQINYSDENGFYNFSTLINGTYNLHGFMENYETFVANVTIAVNQTTLKNVTFAPVNLTLVVPLQNGTINGTVYDNSTDLPLSGATVAMGGQLMTTNSSGVYRLIVYEGEQNLVGIKSGYFPYITRKNVTSFQNIKQDIYLNTFVDGGVSINGSLLQNGTVEGIVISNSTNAPLSSVIVSVGGVTATTDTNGNYSINITEGTHNIVAIKSGYYTSASTVVVNASILNIHNISMALVQTVGVGPGTVSAVSAGGGSGSAAVV